MAFIGAKPTNVPLTSADIQDGTINTADIADGAVTSVKTTGVGGANTPAFSAYAGSDQNNNTDNTWVKLAMNSEFYDTDSKYDVSNYRFTPTVAGKYIFGADVYIDGNDTRDSVGLAFYKNGSKLFFVIQDVDNNTANSITATIDLDSDDYVELYGYADVANSSVWAMNMDGTTSNNRCYWYGYKLIGA